MSNVNNSIRFYNESMTFKICFWVENLSAPSLFTSDNPDTRHTLLYQRVKILYKIFSCSAASSLFLFLIVNHCLCRRNKFKVDVKENNYNYFFFLLTHLYSFMLS